MRTLVSLLSGLVLSLALQPAARAQVVWTGGSLVDNNWSTHANWRNSMPPAIISIATVHFAGEIRTFPHIDTRWSLAGLAFNTGASTFTLDGSELTIGSSGIANNSVNSQAINNNITLGDAQTWSAAAGDLTVGGNVDNGGSLLTAHAESGKYLMISGNVSDDGALTKTGGGTLILSGTNSYSGGTTINAGILQAGAVNAFGTGPMTVTGDGLGYGYGNTATLDLNGFDQTIGPLAGDAGGVVSLSYNSGLGTTGNLTTDARGISTEFAGKIGGGGALTVVDSSGGGMLTLSGASNDYSGGTTVDGSSGSVTLKASGGFGGSSSLGTGAVVVNSGGTLAGNGFITGLTTINSGGHLAPGDPIALTTGVLRFDGGLTLASGSILDFKLGSVSDQIRVTGGEFNVNGPIRLNLSVVGDFNLITGSPYTLIDFSDVDSSYININDFTFGTLPGDTLLGDYSLSLGGSMLILNFNLAAVPEPSTYAAICGALALALSVWRRRRTAT